MPTERLRNLKKRTERTGKSMGLAASQARLLSITRRISDNELRAQLINNQKMRLATESSRVSENYINALNSTNLMFTNYGVNDARQTVPLTYNELTSYNQYNNQYVLSDVAGSVFLREDEAKIYAANKGNLEGYLKAHGIEYTTTYWDTVGSNLSAEELPAAAVIRAWYDTNGIDASAGVEGIEGCSVFPALQEIAERIEIAVDNYDSDYAMRGAICESVAHDIAYSDESLIAWWFPSNWLREDGGNGHHWYEGNDFMWSLEGTNGYLDFDSDVADEFRENVYQVLFRYGNWSNFLHDDTYCRVTDEEKAYLKNNYGIELDTSNDMLTNPAVRKEKATEYLQKATEIFVRRSLNNGGALSGSNGEIKETYRQNLRALGYSDSAIELLNNPVNYADYGVQDLKREFYNILLGTPNEANDGWTDTDDDGDNDNPKWVDAGHGNRENLVKTVKYIIARINDLRYEDLQSRELQNCSTDELRDLFRNGFENEGSSYDAQNVLGKIWANITSSDAPIRNENWTPKLQTNLVNYTWDGNYNNYNYGCPEDFNNDLLLELVYPAAINFFNTHGMPIYGYMKENSAGVLEDATAEAEWYTNLFNKVEQSGYKTLEKGLASSQDWIRFALENGIAIIEQLNTVDTWNKITYNSCSDITEETNSQRATLAEAEYNKAMNQIQAKDERFDLELKNIDTEHSALQKEYESVQKAMTDNVSRTFKMFS